MNVGTNLLNKFADSIRIKMPYIGPQWIKDFQTGEMGLPPSDAGTTSLR